MPKKYNRRWFKMGFLFWFLIFGVIATSLFLSGRTGSNQSDSGKLNQAVQQVKNGAAKLLPSPSPTPFVKYYPPELPVKGSYAVFLVGDSMTDALGPHPFRLSQRLNEAYSETGFIVDNYSLGASNILKLPDLLTTERMFTHKTEPAVLNRDFDILVIESFANNPLSHLPLEEGLQAQRQVMDTTVMRLQTEKPESVIILLATVAPSDNYATGVLDLPAELRRNYAAERRLYLEDFIAYAREKNFPLVNAYDDTRLPGGDAKPGFIHTGDYIHPSQQGIEYIQDKIADYIIENQVIPSKTAGI